MARLVDGFREYMLTQGFGDAAWYDANEEERREETYLDPLENWKFGLAPEDSQMIRDLLHYPLEFLLDKAADDGAIRGNEDLAIYIDLVYGDLWADALVVYRHRFVVCHIDDKWTNLTRMSDDEIDEWLEAIKAELYDGLNWAKRIEATC